MCVHSVRHFIEVTSSRNSLDHDRSHGNTPGGKKRERVPSPSRGASSKSPKMEGGDKSGANGSSYGTASLRLLDLLDALYSKVGRIFNKEAVARLQGEWNSLVGGVASKKGGEGVGEIESKLDGSSGKLYCPEVDQDGFTSGQPRRDGCSVLWHVAWCPILQGNLSVIEY